MRYTVSREDGLGETRIALASNCHTDAVPLLRRMIFRGQDVDAAAQSVPLACALLTARYCGDQFEFAGPRIGGDYAEAIGAVLGRRVAVANVDGMNRTISPGEVDVYAAAASDPPPDQASLRPGPATPLLRTDWSGDFVDTVSRRSDGFAFGAWHTNAAYFAEPVIVSVAIGLLLGRDRIRTLFVPEPADPVPGLSAVVSGLRIVGVDLAFVPPAVATQLRQAS